MSKSRRVSIPLYPGQPGYRSLRDASGRGQLPCPAGGWPYMEAICRRQQPFFETLPKLEAGAGPKPEPIPAKQRARRQCRLAQRLHAKEGFERVRPPKEPLPIRETKIVGRTRPSRASMLDFQRVTGISAGRLGRVRR